MTVLAVLSACTSATMINSQPSGAQLFLNGEPVGRTPYQMSDTKIVSSTTTVRLEMPGFETVNGTISRNEELNVGALILGIITLVPFLWVMGYKPIHTFELHPIAGGYPQPQAYPVQGGYPPPAGYPAPPPAPKK